jgi:hypothetical protein
MKSQELNLRASSSSARCRDDHEAQGGGSIINTSSIGGIRAGELDLMVRPRRP